MAPNYRALKKRQVATLCDQGYWSGNGYEVNNNEWARASATSGSQCTYVDSSSSAGVSWHTERTWESSPNQVKSYAYSGRQIERGRTIASINSMPTSVFWEYDTSDIAANAAYDFFTSEDPNHANGGGDYELMIWCVSVQLNSFEDSTSRIAPIRLADHPSPQARCLWWCFPTRYLHGHR